MSILNDSPVCVCDFCDKNNHLGDGHATLVFRSESLGHDVTICWQCLLGMQSEFKASVKGIRP